jgi:hypothetical protein
MRKTTAKFSLLVGGLMDKSVQLLERCSGYYTPQEYIDEKEQEVFRCGPPV